MNIMKEALILDSEIQRWEGVTGLFKRGAVSQSQ